jgi:hypothetical protein
VRGRRATELLALPVRMHGIELGRPIDAWLDRVADRVVGLEILCGDGRRRFLPFAVATTQDSEIEVSSALALIDERELEFYRRHSRRLDDCGYTDPWIDADGGVHEAQSAA